MPRSIFSGSIPANLTIFCRPLRTIQPKWDVTDTPLTEPLDVLPAIVADAANPVRLKSGKEWAESRNYGEGKGKTTQFDIPNDPGTVRVVDLEFRSEGGRAYKVLWASLNVYVDLREDVLLEAMIAKGIKPGGELGGLYLWAIVGSQMKLIRAGSLLHKELKASTERKTMTAIKKGFEVGHVYRQANGKRLVYLGEFQTLDIFDTTAEERKANNWRYVTEPNYVTKPWHGQIWYEVGERDESAQAAVNKMDYFDFKYRTSAPKVVQDVETVKLKPDVAKMIQDAAIRNMEEQAKRDQLYGYKSDHTLLQHMAQYLNTVAKGSPAFVHPRLEGKMPAEGEK